MNPVRAGKKKKSRDTHAYMCVYRQPSICIYRKHFDFLGRCGSRRFGARRLKLDLFLSLLCRSSRARVRKPAFTLQPAAAAAACARANTTQRRSNNTFTLSHLRARAPKRSDLITLLCMCVRAGTSRDKCIDNVA